FQRIDQVAGDGEHAPVAHGVEDVGRFVPRPHVGLAVLAGVEVAAAVAAVDVRVRGRGDPEAAALGQHAVPDAADLGGHLVEAAEGGRTGVAVEPALGRGLVA